jgi:Ni,Fe-hydrogenase I large subunit
VETLTEKAKASEDEVEYREMIAKAQMYRMFPVETSVLAKMLIKLKKADPETYNEWENLIKAADAQLGASALFGEIGTVRSPEEVEVLEQAMAKSKAENISLKDAMLSMPAYKQQELLTKSRQRAKGGK